MPREKQDFPVVIFVVLSSCETEMASVIDAAEKRFYLLYYSCLNEAATVHITWALQLSALYH